MYMNPSESTAGSGQGYGGQPEIDPGSMGEMDVNYGSYGGEGYDADSFDEEQPLLKELGVDVELIKQKVSDEYCCSVLMFASLCVALDSGCAESSATN